MDKQVVIAVPKWDTEILTTITLTQGIRLSDLIKHRLTIYHLQRDQLAIDQSLKWWKSSPLSIRNSIQGGVDLAGISHEYISRSRLRF